MIVEGVEPGSEHAGKYMLFEDLKIPAEELKHFKEYTKREGLNYTRKKPSGVAYANGEIYFFCADCKHMEEKGMGGLPLDLDYPEETFRRLTRHPAEVGAMDQDEYQYLIDIKNGKAPKDLGPPRCPHPDSGAYQRVKSEYLFKPTGDVGSPCSANLYCENPDNFNWMTRKILEYLGKRQEEYHLVSSEGSNIIWGVGVREKLAEMDKKIHPTLVDRRYKNFYKKVYD